MQTTRLLPSVYEKGICYDVQLRKSSNATLYSQHKFIIPVLLKQEIANPKPDYLRDYGILQKT